MKGIYIGRFQPLHKGHVATIDFIFENNDTSELVIFVGSANKSISAKNPWTYQERKEMIIGSLKDKSYFNKIQIKPLNDYLYNESRWKQQVLDEKADAIFGYSKDESSYYIKSFPELQLIQAPAVKNESCNVISSTDVRRSFFGINISSKNYAYNWKKHLPIGAVDVIDKMEFFKFRKLDKEYSTVQDDTHKLLSNYPYKECLNCCTADALVRYKNKLLIVTRGGPIGKGLLALAGGHKNSDETFYGCAVRELIEETCLQVSLDDLESSLVDKELFDHPLRSQGVAKPTMCFYFNLSHLEECPIVTPADDAAKVDWKDVADLESTDFFDDHFEIIEFFKNKHKF